MEKMTSQQLREIKKISLDMLVYFDDFCKTHNLEYAVSYGTVLGAVRHGGFIPWDDDVDVDMPAEDYHRFVKLWGRFGDKENYFLQTKKTNPHIECSFHRLRKNGTSWIDPGCEKMPLHWGIPIDIFPVYNLPDNRCLRKIQRKLRKYSMKWCSFAWNNLGAPKIKMWFYKELTLLSLWALKVISDIGQKSGKIYIIWNSEKKREVEKDLIFPTKPILFEGIELQGPRQAEKYLEWTYGDWMTPPSEEDREGHVIGILDLQKDSSEYTGYFVRNK